MGGSRAAQARRPARVRRLRGGAAARPGQGGLDSEQSPAGAARSQPGGRAAEETPPVTVTEKPAERASSPRGRGEKTEAGRGSVLGYLRLDRRQAYALLALTAVA